MEQMGTDGAAVSNACYQQGYCQWAQLAQKNNIGKKNRRDYLRQQIWIISWAYTIGNYDAPTTGANRAGKHSR